MNMEKERCVLCGKMTDVSKDIPVDERETYLAGAGQLCFDCYWEIYHTNDLKLSAE